MDSSYFDFALLTPAEQAGGVPFIWSSHDRLWPCASIEAANLSTEPSWASITGLVVRWGDQRIDQLMEAWRAEAQAVEALRNPSAAMADIRRRSYYHLHDGGRVALVLPHWIFELHPIPKMLGTLDTDSNEDPLPVLDPEFNPYLYHRTQPDLTVMVLDWADDAENAEALILMRNQALVVYVAIAEYIFTVHLGAKIDQPGAIMV